jgi:hypothetical protein
MGIEPIRLAVLAYAVEPEGLPNIVRDETLVHPDPDWLSPLNFEGRVYVIPRQPDAPYPWRTRLQEAHITQLGYCLEITPLPPSSPPYLVTTIPELQLIWDGPLRFVATGDASLVGTAGLGVEPVDDRHWIGFLRPTGDPEQVELLAYSSVPNEPVEGIVRGIGNTYRNLGELYKIDRSTGPGAPRSR